MSTHLAHCCLFQRKLTQCSCVWRSQLPHYRANHLISPEGCCNGGYCCVSFIFKSNRAKSRIPTTYIVVTQLLGNFIDITVLCVQFQNDRATEKGVMGERDFVRFESDICFRAIPYITTALSLLYSTNSCFIESHRITRGVIVFDLVPHQGWINFATSRGKPWHQFPLDFTWSIYVRGKIVWRSSR